MNSLLRKCILSLLTCTLLLEIIWAWKWYTFHPMGKTRARILHHHITTYEKDIHNLSLYLENLRKKETMWKASSILHEECARNDLGYSFPQEITCIIPSKNG